ncbi:MAG: rane protein, partial [Gammaproteobacteria bacterium]|nr:rane protein [Gammaproteobacteria bacterium]
MDTLLYVTAATLIVAGLVGAIVPALPGIPLIFGGIWLIARVDQYRHLGLWWL